MTRQYSCLGPCPSNADIAMMQWQHSILDEPTFRAPWTALQNAIHLAHEVGTSSALKVDTVCVRKAHSCKPTVRFANDVHLVIEHDELPQPFFDVFPLDQFSSWHTVPWALRPLHLLHAELPVVHADPLSSAVLISSNRHENLAHDHDDFSMMQCDAAVKRLRAEMPGPPWLAPQDPPIVPQPLRPPLHDAPVQQDGDGENQEFEVQPGSPASSSSSHVSQQVCLFHLDDPPVFGRIDWTDYHMMMFEAARLLQVPEDQLLSLIDIATPLTDLPTDVVPLIAQLVGDIDPGEARFLALADLEIHANQHEGHYFTAPAVDRAVYAFPRIADRRSIFLTVDVQSYCRAERMRCLLYHNNAAVITLGNPVLRITPGDYLKIIIPPPETCEWSTTRALHFFRQRDDDNEPASSELSAHSGYSPSLVPSDELRAQLGFGHDDEQVLLQSYATQQERMPRAKSPPHMDCSFTDAFLHAVRMMSETADNLPDFSDDDHDIADFAPWIQDLHAIWNAGAVLGPGNVERLARFETWFSDHVSFTRCYNSRVVVFAGDFHTWEAQLQRLWRDLIVPGAALEIHLVLPQPEDGAAQTLGQLMIVQRPIAYQSSVVISVYDSSYDQGHAHSHACVLGSRASRHSVSTMIQANEDCPPDQPFNRCELWIGNRHIEDDEHIPLRHGDALRFYIQRQAHQRNASLLPHVETHPLHASEIAGAVVDMHAPSAQGNFTAPRTPNWAAELLSLFSQEALIERDDEGPVAYIQTWFLHGSQQTRCEVPRTVRLGADTSAWQRAILSAWRDHADQRYPMDLFWVDPRPANAPWQSILGHVLIVQEPQEHQVAIVLSAEARARDRNEMQQVAMLTDNYISMHGAIQLFPIPAHLRSYPLRVRRDEQAFPPQGVLRVWNGNLVVIEILVTERVQRPSSSGDVDEQSLLQVMVSKPNSSPRHACGHVPSVPADSLFTFMNLPLICQMSR